MTGPTRALADRKVIAAFLGVVLFGGLNAIAVKATVGELAPFWGAAVRFVSAGAIMGGLVILARRAFPKGRSLTGAMLYGAVGFSASYGLIYTGLRETPAGTVMVLIALTPLFTFGLAIVQGQERFRVQGLVGALVALAGVAVVFADQVSADVPIASLGFVVLGTVCIAETGVIIKWIPRSDPFGTNAVAMLTGGAILLVASRVASEEWAVPTQTATWAAIGYLVALGSVLMFALYVFALERWTASAVSYVTLLMPLVTVSVAAAVIAERVSPALLVGATIVLVGVYLGAFLRIPRRTSASSLPECLPIDACADAPPAAGPPKAADRAVV
jgi:drug/metabolite transporter (DMT)-like permease